MRPKQIAARDRSPGSRRTRTADVAIGHRNLPLLLLQARERVLAHFRPLLKAAGLTEQQWRVIRELLESGPLEPREIVARCGISSPSLAGVLARMEETGLVTRQRLDGDQRRVRVSLAPKAREIARRMAPRIEATYATLEARVGARWLQALYRTLDELIDVVGPAGDEEDAEDAA